MAGLTHELKSPLANIRSAAEILGALKEGEQFRSNSTVYVDMIERNAERLEKAINELMGVFRLPGELEPFKHSVIELPDILERVMSTHREHVKEKGLKLEISLIKASRPVQIDIEKIQQAMSNIISNAVKFTDKGFISVEIINRGDSMEFSVKDSGIGIPATELPYVFDRLYQGQTNQKGKGSGIGLTLAETWVESHGGEIHAESKGAGQGTRVWFRLPI